MTTGDDFGHLDPSEREALLARARGYPFARPRGSYLFIDGEAHAYRDHDDPARLLDAAAVVVDGGAMRADRLLAARGLADVPAMADRVPVLAYGSNAAPEQLARKYADFAPGCVIPVEKGLLADFDIVYGPHLSANGYVPAVIEHAPGTVAEVWITWLAPDQLPRMHESENVGEAYWYGRLHDIDLRVGESRRLSAVNAYVGCRGAIGHEGRPIALAPVPARDRRLPEAGQEAMLKLTLDIAGEAVALETFILGTILDGELRRRRSEAMMRRARPFGYDRFEILNPGPVMASKDRESAT